MPGKDSDPDKWRLRQNTQVKHDILSGYLTRWLAVLGGKPRPDRPRTLHYVDSFAGRGRYSKGEPGSPLIAMSVGQELYDHRGGDPHLKCYNVEHDKDNYESLAREIEMVGGQYPSVSVRNFYGSFEKHADTILRIVPTNEAAFVFLDPFGYRGIELPLVLKFVARRWNEVFITFMSHYIGRYMTDPNRTSAMDNIFGTDEWRKLAEAPTTNQQTGAVELYCRQIQENALQNGKLPLVFPINVEFEDRTADVYHLIHVSHHPKARLVMETAVDKVKLLSAEEKLFIELEVEEFALDALRAASTGRLTALDLAGEVWRRSWYASWRQDIKATVMRDQEFRA